MSAAQLRFSIVDLLVARRAIFFSRQLVGQPRHFSLFALALRLAGPRTRAASKYHCSTGQSSAAWPQHPSQHECTLVRPRPKLGFIMGIHKARARHNWAAPLITSMLLHTWRGSCGKRSCHFPPPATQALLAFLLARWPYALLHAWDAPALARTIGLDLGGQNLQLAMIRRPAMKDSVIPGWALILQLQLRHPGCSPLSLLPHETLESTGATCCSSPGMTAKCGRILAPGDHCAELPSSDGPRRVILKPCWRWILPPLQSPFRNAGLVVAGRRLLRLIPFGPR